MGLGRLLNRSKEITIKDTVTNEIQTFTIVDNIAPDWSTGFYQGSMSIPGAWRASLILSDLLGSLPFQAFRETGGLSQKITPTPPLLEQPNPEEPRINTFSAWALDLILNGNAIGIIAAENAEGWPTAALPVAANRVSVRRVTKQSQSVLPVGSIEYKIGNLTFSKSEVIHIKGPHEPGAVRGIGVLEAHLETLGLAKEMLTQAKAISKHGVPTGALKSHDPDLTEEGAKKLKTGWLEAQRTRTVAVLNEQTDFEPLSWNPEELQLVEARKFTLHEIALIFGVPLSFLGVETSNRTYRNDESEGLNLLRYHLNGHLGRFEQTLSLYFPRGTTVKGNLDSILRNDTLSRYQAHAIGLSNNFLTLNEVRELENRPPLPETEGANSNGSTEETGNSAGEAMPDSGLQEEGA